LPRRPSLICLPHWQPPHGNRHPAPIDGAVLHGRGARHPSRTGTRNAVHTRLNNVLIEEDSVRRAILILVLLVSIASAGFVNACGKTAKPFTITDDLGRQVNIEKTPQSVVSLAPSVTEMLFALGLGETVVGCTEFCNYPDEAKEKPKVGAYYSTSLEAIVDKEPDVVLTDGHDPVGQQLEELGIPLVVLQPADVQGIFRNIGLIGELMNEERKAAELVDDLQRRLDAIAARTETAAAKPTVFFEIDATDPARPWTTGPGSFADTMITLAGGRNIVASGDQWAQISMEELLSSDPDLIILDDYPAVTPEQAMARTGVWQELRAVKQQKVYAINPDLTSRPGPRIIDGLEELAGIIHPELFGG
jgi:iron complex transport system substrate-binding protein